MSHGATVRCKEESFLKDGVCVFDEAQRFDSARNLCVLRRRALLRVDRSLFVAI